MKNELNPKDYVFKASWIDRLSQITTYFGSIFSGKLVGRDQFGNRYFRARFTPKGTREKRWVLYKGEAEASTVPPEWHGYLHHTHDAPLAKDSDFHRSWIKPHLPNLTGTTAAYVPDGHILAGGVRAKATGDYEAWDPRQTSKFNERT